MFVYNSNRRTNVPVRGVFMKRRYYLKNKKRFYSIIVILIVVMLSSFWAVSAHDGSNQQEFEMVKVKSGDTLWSIAKEHDPNGDIRKFIYEIKEANSLKGSMIFAGDELKIPVHF